MSKFIAYRISDGYIIQWQDDEKFNYPEAPAGVQISEITGEDYDNRKDESWYIKGKITNKAPTPAPLPEKSDEEIATAKRLAHSNVMTGSDHLFVNAMRLKLNSSDGWEQALVAANKRYLEIEEE